MSRKSTTIACLLGLLLNLPALAGTNQFILFNITRTATAEGIRQIRRDFHEANDGRLRIGAGAIFSYLNQSRAQTMADLKSFLQAAEQTGTPIVIQLDGENWWGARPDLWNWWDPSQPGYATANRHNVEWSGWSPDDALKIAWRNWGHQIRILPPPNLMSPSYRLACHEEMRVLIPLVLEWWRALPPTQQDLFVGLKLGWESSIGVNAWYYPQGNALQDQPPSADPAGGINLTNPPARGVAQTGYAAVKSAGIRNTGTLNEVDLAEVVRRHLEDLSRFAAELGVPREKLFTHVAGWRENERLYQAGLNQFSCPGWSFYRHAADPQADSGVQTALHQTNAPWWAAAEWWYQGPPETGPWQQALATILAQPRCRYVCIYNWEDVRDNTNILRAVQNLTTSPPSGPGAQPHLW